MQVFIYSNLCFQQQPGSNVTVTVQTVWGGEGTRDTNLFVYSPDDNGAAVSVADDKGNRQCSGGAVPTPANVCPPGQVYVSSSKVVFSLAPGSGAVCTEAAIGAENPLFQRGYFGLLITTNGGNAGT